MRLDQCVFVCLSDGTRPPITFGGGVRIEEQVRDVSSNSAPLVNHVRTPGWCCFHGGRSREKSGRKCVRKCVKPQSGCFPKTSIVLSGQQ